MSELLTNNKNNELIHITERFNEQTEQLEQVVSAREVHKLLEVQEKFSLWLTRNEDIFVEGGTPTPTKITVNRGHRGATQELDDCLITADTAKNLCMVSRTEKAKEVRKYFIAVEKAWNDPMQIMNRALQVAKFQIEKRDKQIAQQKPLVDFAEQVSSTNDLISVREFAAYLNIHGLGQNNLFKWLKSNNYLMHNKLPYREYIENGYFQVIEQTYWNGQINKTSSKTLITGRGQIFLAKKIRDEYNEGDK